MVRAEKEELKVRVEEWTCRYMGIPLSMPSFPLRGQIPPSVHLPLNLFIASLNHRSLHYNAYTRYGPIYMPVIS